MAKQMEHTPTPYKAVVIGGVQGIQANPELWLATMAHGEEVNAQREGNAAFFVRACNNHDYLVGAVKLLVEAIGDENEHDHDPDECDVCYAVDDAKWQLERLDKQGETGANDLLLEAVELITDTRQGIDDMLATEEMAPAVRLALELQTENCSQWLFNARREA